MDSSSWLTAASIATVISAAVTLGLGVFVKPRLNQRLEERKAGLSDENSAKNAKRDYDYKARIRLYEQIEPLMFQLREAAEAAYWRLMGLVRTYRAGNLSAESNWLDGDAYYLRSTMYRLLLPLVVMQIMQRRMTFVDMHLDRGYAQKYRLLKCYALAVTDDLRIAAVDPALDYHPYDTLDRKGDGLKQGLVRGMLDNVLDTMIIAEDGLLRPRTFSEFEQCLATKSPVKESFEYAMDLLTGFLPDEMPVLTRMLHILTALSWVIAIASDREMEDKALTDELTAFVRGDRFAKDFSWDTEKVETERQVTIAYLNDRLGQELRSFQN
jgi:hypothetical protein